MGLPSLSIYANELLREYGVHTLVRVGSCGALTDKVKVRDVVIAMGASTDSSMNRIRFEGLDYAPVADFDLLRAAHDAAVARDLAVDTHVGLVFSSDSFYARAPSWPAGWSTTACSPSRWRPSALYTLAAQHQARALAICTVSDHVVTGEETSAQEREQTFGDMVEIALDAMLN